MSRAAAPDPPLADEEAVRHHRDQLIELAATFDITELEYAEPGWLVGHVAPDRDGFDMANFELAAAALGLHFHLLSAGAKRNQAVSASVAAARSL